MDKNTTLFIAVIGNVTEGFRFVGPFDDFDRACEFCEDHGYYDWRVTNLYDRSVASDNVHDL